VASREIRTLVGSDGRSLDQTIPRLIPPAKMKPTVLEREPSPGVVDRRQARSFFLNLGKPRRRFIGSRALTSLMALERAAPKSRMVCCCATDDPLSQPRVLCSPAGQFLIEDRRTTRFTGPPQLL